MALSLLWQKGRICSKKTNVVLLGSQEENRIPASGTTFSRTASSAGGLRQNNFISVCTQSNSDADDFHDCSSNLKNSGSGKDSYHTNPGSIRRSTSENAVMLRSNNSIGLKYGLSEGDSYVSTRPSIQQSRITGEFVEIDGNTGRSKHSEALGTCSFCKLESVPCETFPDHHRVNNTVVTGIPLMVKAGNPHTLIGDTGKLVYCCYKCSEQMGFVNDSNTQIDNGSSNGRCTFSRNPSLDGKSNSIPIAKEVFGFHSVGKTSHSLMQVKSTVEETNYEVTHMGNVTVESMCNYNSTNPDVSRSNSKRSQNKDGIRSRNRSGSEVTNVIVNVSGVNETACYSKGSQEEALADFDALLSEIEKS